MPGRQKRSRHGGDRAHEWVRDGMSLRGLRRPDGASTGGPSLYRHGHGGQRHGLRYSADDHCRRQRVSVGTTSRLRTFVRCVRRRRWSAPTRCPSASPGSSLRAASSSLMNKPRCPRRRTRWTGRRARWPAVATHCASTGRPALGRPSVSVVCAPTVPTTRAGHAAARGALPQPRIIVGAHGPSVDPAGVGSRQDVPHPVTVVAVDAACTLGEAQSCSDRAAGTLIRWTTTTSTA
jgi:hypothetical protein